VNTNGLLQKHWFHVATHFVADAVIVFVAFILALFIRFGYEGEAALWQHLPSFISGGLAFSGAIYIASLYSTHSGHRGLFERAAILVGCAFVASLVVIGVSYGTSAHPLGRGVMLIGGVSTFLFGFVHHFSLLHVLRTARERAAYIVTSSFDEVETRLFHELKSHNLDFVGVISACGYNPSKGAPVLGTIEDIERIVKEERIDRVLCTSENLGNATLTRRFCQLRYSGVTVMPLIILCEEIQQYVPLELVTHEWLLSASGEPHLLYIKKIKRLFDIIASCLGLILGAPLVLLAAIAIKLTSRGPILYFQTRAGRFGREFQMTKLRTMCVDAEKDGAQWSAADGTCDPRVTAVGRFLRRYRIDEIPQLWQVLCGHMSFVGPRPERPEIIQQVAREIPFYEERLMIQPGITGWAQVTYPYGASVLDARRKLEYDLYYMKHMSLFLDVFILLDTIRIVLTGGASIAALRQGDSSAAMREWTKAKREADTPIEGVGSARPIRLPAVESA
jgi:exopolysaccharide biosynthesis polyprenyl glycosylphosphotransferase